MAPIRVGISGLAATNPTGGRPGIWGVLAHLASLRASPHYEIVAVCNSSVESSQRSIDFHQLGNIKAYGNPEDMANDPNVDLVVCSVNVDKHHMLTTPALRAQKKAFVEWPLGATLSEAQEMAELANKHGLKTIVGTQLRGDPLISKVRQLLDDGVIGEISSSVAWGCPSQFPLDTWMHSATYYLDMQSGGNEFFIYFGHLPSPRIVLDTFTHVLGAFDTNTIQSTLKTHYSNIKVKNFATGETVKEGYKKTAPDHIFVQGLLKSGAVASLAFRRSQGTTDQNCLRWLISGSKGEISVTIPEGQIQSGAAGRKLQLRKGNGVVEDVDFECDEPEHVKSIAIPATNVARIYENFATGHKAGYSDFEGALESQQLLVHIAEDAGYL
ncbi:hypothetical protein ACHAPJ_013543 [Fusarium lateritium]